MACLTRLGIDNRGGAAPPQQALKEAGERNVKLNSRMDGLVSKLEEDGKLERDGWRDMLAIETLFSSGGNASNVGSFPLPKGHSLKVTQENGKVLLAVGEFARYTCTPSEIGAARRALFEDGEPISEDVFFKSKLKADYNVLSAENSNSIPSKRDVIRQHAMEEILVLPQVVKIDVTKSPLGIEAVCPALAKHEFSLEELRARAKEIENSL